MSTFNRPREERRMHPHGCRFMSSKESKSGASVRMAACELQNLRPVGFMLTWPRLPKVSMQNGQAQSEAPKPFSPITALKHNSMTAGPSFSPLKSPRLYTSNPASCRGCPSMALCGRQGLKWSQIFKKQPFL